MLWGDLYCICQWCACCSWLYVCRLGEMMGCGNIALELCPSHPMPSLSLVSSKFINHNMSSSCFEVTSEHVTSGYENLKKIFIRSKWQLKWYNDITITMITNYKSYQAHQQQLLNQINIFMVIYPIIYILCSKQFCSSVLVILCLCWHKMFRMILPSISPLPFPNCS